MQLTAFSARVSMAFLECGALADALKECAELFCQYLGFGHVQIWTVEDVEDGLILQATAGAAPQPDDPQSQASLDQALVGRIAATKEPCLLRHPSGGRAFTGHPLLVGERVVGVVGLHGELPALEAMRDVLPILSQELAFHMDRQRSEEALCRVRQELEARVDARTAELRAANEALRESREQLRSFAAHLESVREEERATIAREIHDELGQALTALRFDITRLTSKPAADEMELLRRVEEMLGIVDATIQAVRRISTELRPGILDDLGLVAAIEWQAQEFEARTGIACALSVRGMDRDLDRDTSTGLFRIVQEALTNVARHAGATRVQIALEAGSDRLRLRIRDNGCGISEAALTDRGSLGLMGMRERVKLRGGTVTIGGPPGRGTTIAVEIPFRAGEEH